MWQPEQLEIANFVIAEFEPNSNFRPAFNCFEIHTCQRSLYLTSTDKDGKTFFSQSRRHFIGADAYEYLLRFACGLESEIKGETDVFGQVKTAFKNLSIEKPDLYHSLNIIFQKLLEDTKEIRAYYLQGIGGNTYGALTRRLMNPTEADRVLVIGAGDISKSVAPYFADSNLTIWNRSSQRLNDLGADLAKKGLTAALSTDSTALSQAISNATIVVIATPSGSSIEDVVATNLIPGTKVLHLGAQAKDTKLLPFHSLSLTDLFEMEKEQGEIRQKQVRQAIQACHERALLRGLSRSIHIAHGWEDLAVFN